jgi:hypothetical protein
MIGELELKALMLASFDGETEMTLLRSSSRSKSFSRTAVRNVP